MDLFRLLGGGTKFDRRRFNDDMKIFDSSKKENDADVDEIDPDITDATDDLLNEIDFFNGSRPLSSRQQQQDLGAKKRKKTPNVVTNEEVFGVSASHQGTLPV